MKKNKKNVKNMSISTKMSVILGIIFLVAIGIICTITLTISKLSFESALNSRFMEMASKNTEISSDILNEAFLQANNINQYVTDEYPTCAEALANDSAKQSTTTTDNTNSDSNSDENKKPSPFVSVVYDKELNLQSYNMEDYLIKNLCYSIKSSDCIVGMGVFFNPDTISKNIEYYTLYADNNDAENMTCRSYGEDYTDDDWFAVPVETKKPYVTEPYMEGDLKIITVSYPIIYNDEAIGVATADIDLSSFSQIKSSDSQYKSLAVTLISDQDLMMYNSKNTDMIGKKAQEFYGESENKTLLSEKKSNKPFNTVIEINNVKYKSYQEPIEINGTYWWAETLLEYNDFYDQIIKMVIFLVIIAIIFVAIAVVVTIRLVRKMLKPLSGVVSAANNIADGNFNVDIKVQSNDETGQISLAFKKMIGVIDNIKQQLVRVMGNISDGDWTSEFDKEAFIGDWQPVCESTDIMIDRVNGVLQQINKISADLSESSEQVSSASINLSQSSTEQASSIEELFATMSDISEKIGKSASYAMQCKGMAQKSKEVLDEGNTKMLEMNKAMSNIAESASKIGEIIKTIDDIASQTNILALNAAIEAARAGAAGQGFAVVADEVRNLAQKSTVAAKNTQVLIENTINTINSGAKIVEETTQSIQLAVESSNKTEEFVNTIASISEEQSNNVKQITVGIEQVSSSVQTNSATSEETAASSEELSRQAQEMKDIVNQFKIREEQ